MSTEADDSYQKLLAAVRRDAEQVIKHGQAGLSSQARTWYAHVKREMSDSDWIDRRVRLLTELEQFIGEFFGLRFGGQWLHKPVHRPLFRYLDKSVPLVADRPLKQTSRLFLAARNTFKTSIFVPYETQITLRDKEVRCQIGGFRQAESEHRLAMVKKLLESEQAWFWFPDHVWYNDDKPRTVRWTKDALDLRGRRQLVDPCIWAVSYGVSVAGAHAHNRLLDDVVNEETCNTADLLQKTISTWEYLNPCSSLNLIEDIVGTFYDRDDLYSWLIREGFVQYKWIVPAYVTKEWLRDYPEMQDKLEFDEYPLGKLLFENRLTEEFLEQAAERLSDYVFGCQYLLNPTAKTSRLKREWLRPFKQEELPKNVVYYMTGDPGVSTKAGSSEGALVVCAWTHDGHCYIVDLEAGRWNTREFAQRAVTMYKRWAGPDFMEFGMERVSFQAALHEVIRLVAQEEGIGDLPLVELPGAYLGVGRRVDRISGPASMGMIHCADHLIPLLMPQWERFPDPSGRNMDRLDAVSYQFTVDKNGERWVVLPYEPALEASPSDYSKLLPSQRPPEMRKSSKNWRLM